MEYTNGQLEAMVFSGNWVDRMHAAERGYGLDVLIYDTKAEVRGAVAARGYRLDRLVDDDHWYVRSCVAERGYGLKKLVKDPNVQVRLVVAKQRYGLDELVKDPDVVVRAEVAKQGYRVEDSVVDPEPYISEAAKGYVAEQLGVRKPTWPQIYQWLKDNVWMKKIEELQKERGLVTGALEEKIQAAEKKKVIPSRDDGRVAWVR